MRISAVIITYNEERTLGRCLDALKGVADEVLVVDSGSTDATCCIAVEKGARVISHEWEGYGSQKNFANAQTKYEYVLSVDADEVLSFALREQLQNLKISVDPPALLYAFPRKNWYMTRFIKHAGWYPDYKPRLFRKDIAQWSLDSVHEQLEFDSSLEVRKCKGDLEHYTYQNFSAHMAITQKYTDLSACVYLEKGKKSSVSKILFSPIWVFIKTYVFQGGFLDGWDGFLVCKMTALSTFLKYAKLKDLEQRQKRELHE